MITPDLPRSTASARVLFDVALQQGLDPATCLRATGLDSAQLHDPTREITGSQEERLIQNIVENLGNDPALAFDAGSRYSLPTFGMFGLVMLSAATAREMVELSIRYQELSSTLARARLVTGDSHTFIEINASHLADAVQNFVIDHCMAVVWSHTCVLDGVPACASMMLRRPRPADPTCYHKFFGFDPTFGAPENRIGFSDAYLDRRRPQVDPMALDQCREQCEALVQRRRARIGAAGFAAIVRERLERSASKWPSMSTIASDLNLSTRTLARRLSLEGTTFRGIDEAARRARAEHLLRETTDPVERVASAVGYATNSAFVRAFKRWHAMPPGLWRRQTVNPLLSPRDSGIHVVRRPGIPASQGY